jgi:hypothetical protein
VLVVVVVALVLQVLEVLVVLALVPQVVAVVAHQQTDKTLALVVQVALALPVSTLGKD